MFLYANDPHSCRDGCPYCGYFEPHRGPVLTLGHGQQALDWFAPYDRTAFFEPLPAWWP